MGRLISSTKPSCSLFLLSSSFDSAVKSFDFEQNPDEPCVYRKYSGDKVTFLVLYVDDILLIGIGVGMFTTVKGKVYFRQTVM
ncbi:hypothetical protein AWY89_10700 [Pasteurella multocida subsp. multocida]|nr:hypothetical protein AWY89_10700 [Pasteurella multocida subsp. multocida]